MAFIDQSKWNYFVFLPDPDQSVQVIKLTYTDSNNLSPRDIKHQTWESIPTGIYSYITSEEPPPTALASPIRITIITSHSQQEINL